MKRNTQWDGRVALVKFLKGVCTHKEGQKKVIPLAAAKRYERKDRVKILKIIDNI